MSKYIYAVRDGELWHTGEFDRTHPPCAYLGEWEEASFWTIKEGVEEYVKEFGGEVVTFELHEKP